MDGAKKGCIGNRGGVYSAGVLYEPAADDCRVANEVCHESPMKNQRIWIVLLLLVWLCGPEVKCGQGQDWLERQVPGVWEDYEDEDLPVKPGLLGRHYLELQYLQVEQVDNELKLDDPARGFSFGFNVPARWNDRLPSFLGQDVFVSTLGLYANASDSGSGSSLDVELRSFSSGLNTYLFVTDSFRPFVQLGMGTRMVQADVNFLGIALPFGDLETRFLVYPGFELDLGERLAWRNVLELETKGSVEDSLLRSELVLWPGSRWFLKGGLAGDVSGNGWGFLIGGGYSW